MNVAMQRYTADDDSKIYLRKCNSIAELLQRRQGNYM